MAGRGSGRTRVLTARGRIVLVLAAVLGALALSANAFAGGPAISSDQPDYAPGSTVVLTGSGWGVGESVHVTVDDTVGQTWTWASDPDPFAGLDGSFTVTVTLPNYFISDYSVHAYGSSGSTAAAAFTDKVGTSTAIAQTAGSNPTTSGASVTFTATVASDTTTDGSPTGTVDFKDTASGGGTLCANVTLVQATSTTSTASCTTSSLASGSRSIKAFYSGTSSKWNTSNSDPLTLVVQATKQNQATLSVTGPGSATFGAADQAITTTGGSGTGAITFSAGSSTACSISGSNLHVTSGTGTCTITATKAGDATYNPTTSAGFDVTIDKASQTITFTSTAPSSAVVGGSYQPTATGGGSGNAVTFGATGACSYNGITGLVSMNAVGTCTVTADQLGNDNYAAAAQETQSFSVGKGDQTIAVTTAAPANAAFGAQFTVVATATSGLAVAYSSDGSCSNVGATFTITSGSGTCTVKFDQAGDGNWNAAPQVTETVTAAKATATLAFAAGDLSQTYDGSTKTVGVTTTPSGLSGVTVTYTQGGNPATPKDAGSYAVSATLDNPNYAATPIGDTLVVGKAAASLAFVPADLSQTYDGSTKTVGVTTTPSGLAGASVTYSQGGDPATPKDAGDYAVSASLDNPNYAATPISDTLTIAKASSTTTVTCPAGPYVYTGSPLTPCTVTVTGAGGLSLTPAADYSDNTNAGTATASYTYAGDANYEPSHDSQTFTIGKAGSTTAVTCPAHLSYTGSALTPCTVEVTGVGGLSLTPDPTYADNTNAGTATASYTYVGDANHAGSSDSQTFTIDKAGSTTKVTCPAHVTYTGSPLEPCTVAVTGAALDLAPAASYTNNTYAGTASASYDFVGDANHTGSHDSATFTIDKASSKTTVTCTAGPFTYTGHAQTPCAVSVTGAGALTLTPDPTYSHNTNAGVASASYSYAGDANHEPSGDSTTFTIQKAHLTVTADPASSTYGEPAPSSLTATLSAFVNGEDASVVTGTADCSLAAPVPTNAGTYHDEVVCAVGSLAADNYDFPTFMAGAYTIEKAHLTVTADPASITYGEQAPDASTLTATVSGFVKDDGAVAVSGKAACSLRSPLPTGAGTYTDEIVCSAGTLAADNYDFPAENFVSGTYTIHKAHLTVTADPASITYGDPAPTSLTATLSGFVNGDQASVVSGTAACSLDNAPSAAGVYADEIVCAVGTLSADNYDFPTFVAGTYTIHKAHLTVTADPVSITYGDPVPSSLTATLSGFVNGEGVSVVDGTADCSLATPVPTNAGTYHDEVVCAIGSLAAGNYDFPTFVAGTYTIEKAASTTAVTCPASTTYTGNPLTPCTVKVTGAGGLSLTPDPTYADNTNAGTATASYTYGGDDNHLGSHDSQTFTIEKATSTTTVACPAHVTYTGSALTPCSATVTGAGGLSLTPDPAYAGNTDAGTATASYTFAGDANHDGSSDSKTFTIDKASSTTVVTCTAHVTYTGSALAPCTVEVTGAGGLSLTPDPAYAGNTDAGTATASYTFGGDANHEGSSDSATFTIDKASSTTIVTCPATVSYTAAPQTPCTAAVTGAGGLNQALPATYANNTAVGTATANASYAGDPNHNGSTDAKNFKIVYGYGEVQFLQPINGTAHSLSTNPDVSTFKAGSTVPVKVQVKLPNGTIVHPASAAWLTPVSAGQTTQPVDATVSTDAPTNGPAYLWDTSGQFYQYNWGTSKSGAGSYWLIGVKLDDGQTYTVYISLR